jgi:hypothetical protein
MAVRAVDYAAAEHLEDLAYLAANLKADPQAAAFAPDVEAVSVALKTQSEEWNLNRHVVQETQTGLRNVSEALCNVVRAAHAVILDDPGRRLALRSEPLSSPARSGRRALRRSAP